MDLLLVAGATLNKDFASIASNDHNRVIDEHGFAAILESDELVRDLTGIIGGPRVNPTSTGLWIEDSFPALIDRMTFALLEDFVRRERFGQPLAKLVETDDERATSEVVSRSARAPNRRASRLLCTIA